MYIKFLLLLFIMIAIYYCFKNKIKIKFKTFLKKGFKVKKGVHTYLVLGFL